MEKTAANTAVNGSWTDRESETDETVACYFCCFEKRLSRFARRDVLHALHNFRVVFFLFFLLYLLRMCDRIENFRPFIALIMQCENLD